MPRESMAVVNHFDVSVKEPEKLMTIHGFADKMAVTGLIKFSKPFVIGTAADKNDGGIHGYGSDRTRHGDPVGIGEVDIRQHDGLSMLPEKFQPLLGGACRISRQGSITCIDERAHDVTSNGIIFDV